MADLEHAIPNTPESVFEAGSVSKQFAAAAILLLAQDGALKLDDDIRRYLPEMPDYGQKITVGHLLTHTSGIRDWGHLTEIEGWPKADHIRAMTQLDILAVVARQKSLNFLPGDEYNYSNSGYNLLPFIVERVSGQSFSEFSKRRIFEPLGLKSTQWRDDFRRVVPNRAIAYAHRKGAYAQMMPFEDAIGAGGLLTTVGDLLKWNEALTARRLGAFVADALERPGVLNDGRRILYAHGLRVTTRHGTREVSHAGGTGGYRTWLGRFPEKGLSIAILCNAGDVGGSASHLGYEIADGFLPARPAPAAKPVRPADLTGKAGLYVSETTGVPIRLIVKDGGLRQEDGPALMPEGSGVWTFKQARITFSANAFTAAAEDGNIDRFRRTESVTAVDITPYLGRYDSDEVNATYFAERKGDVLTLRLDRRPHIQITLRPIYKDAFVFDTRFGPGTGLIRFVRGANQSVTGMDFAWNERIRGVRFVGTPAAASGRHH